MSSPPLKHRRDFRPAQKWATETLKRPFSDGDDWLPGVILAWDMGAGKTVVTLTALRDLLDAGEIKKALVVAPKLVAQTTWPDEIDEWAHLTKTTYTVLRVEDDEDSLKVAEDLFYIAARREGLETKEARKIAKSSATEWRHRRRRRLAEEDTELHIINKEGLPWLWEHLRDGKDWPYDVIVIDEASMLKSGAKRVKRGKGKQKGAPLSRFGIIAKASRKAKTIYELTGTPSPNGLRNLWGLAYPVDFGERLGTARTKFEQRWFTQNKYTYEFTPTPSAEREIMGRLGDIMFSLAPEDYPDLPPLNPLQIKVKLSSSLLREYQKFEKHAVSLEYDVEAVNAGVLHNKLLQFANGSMYQETGEDIWIHDEKLHALEELVERLDGEPLLVAYSYKFDLDRIKRRFPKAVVLNETDPRVTKKKWNQGKIPLLLAHPASAGHGLNFQFGGNNACWYGLTSDLELYLQFNKRLHRPGQVKPVNLHHIIAKGTIDERILPIYLDPKKATQDRVLSSVVTKF